MKDAGRIRHTMKKFSAEMKLYCERSGLSQSDIAKAIGLNPSTVCKVFNGDSSAATWDNISLICGELCLSTSALEHLRNTYEKEYYSEEEQRQHEAFGELLYRIEQVIRPAKSQSAVPSFELPQSEGTALYYGVENVLAVVHDVVSSNLSKSDECVVRISSAAPQPREVMRQLTSNMAASCKRLYIRHMIALESKSVTSVSSNFAAICNLVPVLLSEACTYSAHYYYRQDGTEVHNPFPAHIITEDRVMLISEDFDEAIVIDDKDIVESYRRRFDRALARTRHIRAERKDVRTAMDELHSISRGGNTVKATMLAASPPIAYLMDVDSLKANLKPEYAHDVSLVDKMCEITSGWDFMQYITLDGIDRFIDTGISSDPRHAVFAALSPENRLAVLERLRETIAQDGCIRIIRPGRLHVPEGCCIEHISDVCLNIIVKCDEVDDLRVLSFKESSSVYAADSFAEHLFESMLAYTGREALEHLDHRIAALRERIENK